MSVNVRILIKLPAKPVLAGTLAAVALLCGQPCWAQDRQATRTEAAFEQDLRGLLALAVQDHPSLRARRAEVGAAQSEVQATRWQYWPTPTVSVQRPDQPLIKGTDRAVQLIGLKQSLWTGGRLEAASALALARQAGAESSWQEARRDIALEVIQAYTEAHTARARWRAWQGSVQMHQRLLVQIQRRAATGVSAPSDIALAQGRLQGVLADQTNAQLAADAALERLRTHVGQPLEGELSPPEALFAEIPEVEAAVDMTLDTDPTLARLRTDVQELQAQVSSTTSNLWPELSLSVTQRQGDVTGRSAQVMLGFESKWGAGLSNFSAIEAASKRLQAKQDDVDYRIRKIGEQIRAELRQLASGRERVQAYQNALQAAQAVAQSWDRQYFAGKKSWQEVMNAARETAQTEVQWLDATGAVAATEWRLAVLTRGIDELLQGATADR
jgi:adhesin transport system outer membrane protein